MYRETCTKFKIREATENQVLNTCIRIESINMNANLGSLSTSISGYSIRLDEKKEQAYLNVCISISQG